MTLDPAAVDRLLTRASADVSEGRLSACQLAMALDGQVVVRASFGTATDTSRLSVFSVTKALIAGTVWSLMGDELFDETTLVADVIPAFGTNDKRSVTVEHLLTHSAGFPRAPMRPEEGATSEGRQQRFAAWRLDSEPGSRTEYHSVSAHWVLAELIERATGQDYRAVVRRRVLEPLGLTRLQLGVPAAEQHDILDVELVGQALSDGPAVPVVAASDLTLRYNEPGVREVGVPGAGAVSDAAEITLLYQALLHDPLGLWRPELLADATSRVRYDHPDPFTGVPANRTLGLAVAGDDGHAALREFGKATGPRAFGASGLGGQIAWADPDSGLSFCYLTNGMEADIVASFLRSSRLSTLAARCVRRQECAP